MNTTEFKKIIANIVREELQKTIPIVLNEYFSKNDDVDNKDNNSISEELIEQKMNIDMKKIKEQAPTTTTPKQHKTYVKDPVLNSILNETVCKIPTETSMMSFPSGRQSVPIAGTDAPSGNNVLPKKNYAEILKKSMSKKPGGNLMGFSTEG